MNVATFRVAATPNVYIIEDYLHYLESTCK